MPKNTKGVMGEFKRHELHSGSRTGPVVKNRKQAVAIALSENQKLKGGTAAAKAKAPAAKPAAHPHKNLGAFLHPPKKTPAAAVKKPSAAPALGDRMAGLRANGAFASPAPRGAI